MTEIPLCGDWSADLNAGGATCCAPLRLSGVGDLVLITGHSSGHVVFRNAQNGRVLYHRRFHDSPVASVRVRMRADASGLYSSQTEDLTVVYAPAVTRPGRPPSRSGANDTHVVHIDGVSLYGVLLACARYQAFRGGAGGNDDDGDVGATTAAASLHESGDVHTMRSVGESLVVHKWRLRGMQRVNDVVACGVHAQPLRAIEPSVVAEHERQTVFLAAGQHPAFATFAAIEAEVDESTLQVAVAAGVDAAKQLTSAVLGFARSWWSTETPAPATPSTSASGAAAAASGEHEDGDADAGSSDGEEEGASAQRQKVKKGKGASVTCALFDGNRVPSSLAQSALGDYVAAPDNLGRVVVLNAAKFHMAKVLKGYREAQVAWMYVRPQQVASKQRTPQHRAVEGTFLIVYAPRRGMLQAWRVGASHPHPVCTLRLPDGCRLLYAYNQELGGGPSHRRRDKLVNSAAGARCYVLHESGALQRIALKVAK